jgi:hypothetical protein
MDANRLSLSVLPVIYVVAYTFLSRFSVESTSHLPGGAQRKGKVSSFFQCLFFGHLRSHPDSRSLFIGVAVRVYLKIKKFISCCRRRLQKALVLSCHHVSRPLFQKGFSHTKRKREREIEVCMPLRSLSQFCRGSKRRSVSKFACTSRSNWLLVAEK